jgi:hypothetical protein
MSFVWDTQLRSLLRHYTTSQKVTGLIPNDIIGFFNLPNLSSGTTALELTQHLTEITTRNLAGGNWQPARKADNLIAICEPII